MIAVHQDAIIRAYDRWCSVCGTNAYHTFWKFLKTELPPAVRGGFFQMNKEGEPNLNLLLGPHWETIIKVYKARK